MSEHSRRLAEALAPFEFIGQRTLWQYLENDQALCWAAPNGGNIMLSDFRLVEQALRAYRDSDEAREDIQRHAAELQGFQGLADEGTQP